MTPTADDPPIGPRFRRVLLDAVVAELWEGPTIEADRGAAIGTLAALLDVPPLDILASVMRRHLAVGLPIHPSLIQVMDNLIPGWRE